MNAPSTRELEAARGRWAARILKGVLDYLLTWADNVGDLTPTPVEHFYALRFDDYVGIWAPSDEAASELREALQELFRAVFDDDELELELETTSACRRDAP